MRRPNIDALFRYNIDPIGPALANREHQRVKSSFVQNANFQVCVGRRYRDRQPFVGQPVNVAHAFQSKLATHQAH